MATTPTVSLTYALWAVLSFVLHFCRAHTFTRRKSTNYFNVQENLQIFFPDLWNVEICLHERAT